MTWPVNNNNDLQFGKPRIISTNELDFMSTKNATMPHQFMSLTNQSVPSDKLDYNNNSSLSSSGGISIPGKTLSATPKGKKKKRTLESENEKEKYFVNIERVYLVLNA